MERSPAALFAHIQFSAAVPTPRPIPYRTSALLIVLLGIAGALAVYADARHRENERTVAEFERRVDVRHSFTREVLHRYTESMFGLSTIFALESTITRDEFARATAQLLPRLSGALAFEWAPYVPLQDRDRVESAMRRAYAPQRFDIVEFDAQDRMKRAPDRPYYFPLCYVEPLRGNELVLGYDLMTAPTKPFLDIARRTRQMTVSNQFRLRQETGNELGVVIILPVFRPPLSGATPGIAPGDGMPAGYLQCVFHVREFLEEATATPRAGAVLDVLYLDGSERDPQRRVLYYRPSTGIAPADPKMDEAAFRASAPLVRELPLSIGSRDWRVLYRPQSGWVESQHTITPFWHAATVLSVCGLLAGFVTVIGRRTQTIRREVELRTAELAESRRQFASLVHSLPGMAFRAKYENRHFQVLFASEGALGLTGCPAEDFMSGAAHIREFIHPADMDLVRDAVRAAVDARKDLEFTYRLRTRSGVEKWVLARGRAVYNADGKAELLECIIIDISDQKKAEEARLALERKLLETQKLESLGLLAGGIAHDFNNLLSAVLGNASLARLTLEAGSPADPQLRAIETAALRAAELCRQMLAYAGKGQFVVERVDVSAIVEDLLPLLRVSIARSAELRLELGRELPGVKADATQIRQIVMNLVLNAVDAVAGRNGEITVRTGAVEMDRDVLARCVAGESLPLGTYVFIEVSDTGCGMSPEVRSKMFDPFFTTKFAGRGLGLAAVLGIVRGHNGALMVESEVDHGSKFRLFLPAMLGERVPEPAAPPAAPARWTRAGDVLVIEDEEAVRVVLHALLKRIGFTVQAVGDGRAGIELFRENANRWALVIVDLIMPGMTGEQTLAALQAIRSDLRVLLVSGNAESGIMSRVQGAGRIRFLSKPFKREEFEAKLKELLT